MKAMAENQLAADDAEPDARWSAIVARDASADGRFYYAVKTTGIYCRPSCPARLAKPENVIFYDTCQAAEEAGFRPCKRCKPDRAALSEQQAQRVAAACRLIERADELPSLQALATHAGMSAYHFHRLFKRVTGLTPKAYALAHRAEMLRRGLQRADTVTEAIFDAGYSASSRFYAQSDQMLGMTPSAYRAGGVDIQIRFALGACALGAILVAMTVRGVCTISLGDDPQLLLQELQERFPKAELTGGDADFERYVATVVGFMEAPAIGLDLPLDIRGTAFQQRVWQALQQIPAGSTASYSEIARRIGMPKAVRAVAGACAANPLAVAIPCHRVVRTDGDVSGYRWGVARKRALLASEREQSLVK